MKDVIDPMKVYEAAIHMAIKRGQVDGVKNEYYVTLMQLEDILKQLSINEIE